MLKFNSKHVAADGVVRVQNKCERLGVLLTGEKTGKTVTSTVKVFKKDEYL